MLCVDYATEVWQELESRRNLASPRVLRAREDGDGQVEGTGGDPDYVEMDLSL